MNKLEVAKEAIASNETLNDSLKHNIMELVTIFNKNFEQVSLDNFNERIKTLRIKRGSSYLQNTDSVYRPLENALYLNEKMLMKVDAKHSLMMTILQIITAKKSYYGMNNNGKLKGLNIGFTEMIANNLVGNEEEIKNYDELVMVNLAVEIAGVENTLNAYFSNKSEIFTKPFINNSNNMERATSLLDEIEYNYIARNKINKSHLGENIEVFLNIHANESNIEKINQNIVFYPEHENIDYSSLNRVKNALKETKQEEMKTI